jgi:hypothetical protein
MCKTLDWSVNNLVYEGAFSGIHGHDVSHNYFIYSYLNINI